MKYDLELYSFDIVFSVDIHWIFCFQERQETFRTGKIGIQYISLLTRERVKTCFTVMICVIGLYFHHKKIQILDYIFITQKFGFELFNDILIFNHVKIHEICMRRWWKDSGSPQMTFGQHRHVEYYASKVNIFFS